MGYNEDLEKFLGSRQHRIKILGLGGSGCWVVDNLQQVDNRVARIGINTDESLNKLKNIADSNKLLIGYMKNGYNGDYVQVKKLAKDPVVRKKIAELVRRSDLVIIVGYFGGGTGTGLMEETIKIVRENNSIPFPMIGMPFEFEGSRGRIAAEKELDVIRNICNYAVVVDSEVIMKKYPELTLQNSFFMVANKIWEIISEFTTSLLVPSKYGNLTINDLNEVLGYEGSAAVILGEGATTDIDEIVSTALEYPAVAMGGDIAGRASGAWIQLTVGNNVSNYDVNLLRSEIKNRYLKNGEYGQTEMHIAIRLDDEYKGSAKIFGLLTGIRDDDTYLDPDGNEEGAVIKQTI